MKFKRALSKKQALACLSLFSLANFLAPPAVWAEAPPVPTGTPVSGISNLDLSSTAAGVPASSVMGSAHQAVIMVGGRPQTVTSGMNLTPAAALAVSQVVTAGRQTLNLGPSFAAAGGSLILNQSAANVSSMSIPSSVRVLQGLDTNVLNIAGLLNNAGTLYLAARAAGKVLDVNAGSIVNSGLISTVTGSALDLNLNAVGDIVNSGRIASGGNLSLNAGGAVSNSGTVQAARNVGLNAAGGSITNSGSVISDAGNVTFSSAGNLSVNGVGGTVQALLGSINFREGDYAGKGFINVNGGDYYSTALNLNAGHGLGDASVRRVSGLVNVTAADAHFAADTPMLSMGDWITTDDPSLTNTGNIDIKSLKPVRGSDYLILAGGSITASSPVVIDTSGATATANGGNVVLAAGVTFKGTTINGTSASGGNIDITGAGYSVGSTWINTSSSKVNGTAGNVTLAAYTNASGSFGGHVKAPFGIVTTQTGGGTSGDVTVIANAASKITGFDAAAVTINLGDITTGAATSKNGTGNVTVATTGFNGQVVLVSSTGAIKSGTFTGGAARSGAVSVGNVLTNGGSFSVTAGQHVSGLSNAIAVSSINTAAATATGSGGNVSLKSGAVAGPGSGSILVAGASISTGASGSNNSAGSVTIDSSANITVPAINAVGSAGANGNNVLLNAKFAAGSLNVPAISTTGASGGNVAVINSGSLTGTGQILTGASGTSGTPTSGGVMLAAGATGSVNGNGISLTPTGAGGNVTYNGFGSAVIDSSGTGTNASGGPITVLAYGNGVASGSINFGTTGSVVSGATGVGRAGDITMVAGRVSGDPVNQPATEVETTIQANTINSSGGLGGTGAVALYSASPAAGLIYNNGLATFNSSVKGSNVSGVVKINAGISTAGGGVDITAGRNGNSASLVGISVGAGGINTVNPTGDGGDVNLTSGITTPGATTRTNITVSGPITTQGNLDSDIATLSNKSGDVRIIAPNNITVSSINTGDAAITRVANGGNVLLHAANAATAGSVTFTTITTNGTSGGNVEIVAGTNMTTSSNNPIDTSAVQNLASGRNEFGNGGAVTLVAGAFSTVSGNTTTLVGPSTNGGNINFQAATGTINTSSKAHHGSGGTIRMVAYDKAGGGTNGFIRANNLNLLTNGAQRSLEVGTNVNTNLTEFKNLSGGASGDVFIEAGGTGTSGSPQTITVNNIDTTTAQPGLYYDLFLNQFIPDPDMGGAPNTGFVELLTQTPASAVSIDNSVGKISSGSFLTGNTVSASILAGSITTTGGNIRITAGNAASGAANTNAIQTGALTTTVPFYDTTFPAVNVGWTGDGGYVTLFAGTVGGGTQHISTGSIDARGASSTQFQILASGSAVNIPDPTYTGQSGAVTIITGGNITVTADGLGRSVNTGDTSSSQTGNTNRTGAIGGNVLMLAGTPGAAGGTTGIINISGSIQSKGWVGGNVELYSIGPGGTITAGSISTNAYSSAETNRFSGAIAISSPTTVNLGALNTTATGQAFPAGVFVSAGGTITVSSINTGATAFSFAVSTGGSAISPVFTATDNGSIEIGGNAPNGNNQGDNIAFNTTGTPPIVANRNPNPASTLFYKGGGFSSWNTSGEILNIGGSGTNHMIIPMVSLGAGGIVSNGDQWNNSGAILRFVGNQITWNATSVFPLFVSTGDIDVTVPANNTYVGQMTSRSSVSVTNATFLSQDIISPSVTLNSTETALFSGNIVAGDNIRGFNARVLTQDLNLSILLTAPSANVGQMFGFRIGYNTSNNAAIVYSSPFYTVSGSEALQLNNLNVGWLDLSNTGSVKVDGATVTAAPNGTSNTPPALMQIVTNATSAQSGSILLHGDIDGDKGNILFVAAGSIYTTGAADTTIHALGRTGVLESSGGNSISFFAGANSTEANFIFNVIGRSGFGGDISLTGLDPNQVAPFIVTTDLQSNGGNITLAAFANSRPDLQSPVPAAGSGGNITIPIANTLTVTSPGGTAAQATANQGITIIGEAGGAKPIVTISTGDLNGGVCSVRVGSQTPNINTLDNPRPATFSVGILQGTANPSGIFQGTVSPNSSVTVGNVTILGSTNAQQQVDVQSGGNLNINSITTIGLQGFTDQTTPGLNAFPGGSGGKVSLSSNFDLTVHGDILAYGGGGGGAKSASGVSPNNGPGGAGGNGGPGGSVSITSVSGGIITVLGDINASGGGGGGGGGGFFGVNTTPAGSLGGPGGAGGQGGTIQITSNSSIGKGTIIITGDVTAAGGGAGGKGGDALGNNPLFGGSGGGGGGSLGAGGGGGGGGGSQPSVGASGYGGAGGGGLLPGGGGDIRTVASQIGQGGFGGGGLFIGGVPVYTPGRAGTFGRDLTKEFPATNGGSNPSNPFLGGNGAWYNQTNGMTSPPPGIQLRQALGGDLGLGGEGGISLTPAQPTAGGVAGSNISSLSSDGTLKLNASSYTVPANVYVGALAYQTPVGSSGGITIQGKQQITGRAVAFPVLGLNFLAVVQTSPGQQGAGNITFLPNTQFLVDSNLFINAISPSATISIGANSTIAATNGNSPLAVLFVGTAPAQLIPGVTVPFGKGPSNVGIVSTSVSKPVFGASSISATGSGNTLYQLGVNSLLIFSAPTSKQIVLNGGVQIAASQGARLTSIDLTDLTTASSIVTLQQSFLTLGGKLTFTGTPNQPGFAVTGGTLQLYPFQVNTLSALNIPKGVTLTMTNFTSAFPITVIDSVQSTSPNLTINGALAFTSTGPTIDPHLTFNSVFKPTFTVSSTGKITSSANLTLSSAGDMIFNGPVTASKDLSISTQAGSAGDITVATAIKGKNITISTAQLDPLAPGPLGTFTGTSGSITGTNVTINTSAFNLVNTKISAGTGTVTIDNNNNTSLAASAISIAGAAAFNLLPSTLTKIGAGTLQIGSTANTGGITVGGDLNTVSATTNAGFVGVKNLSLTSNAGITTNGFSIVLGTKTLKITSVNGQANLGAVTGGSTFVTAGNPGIKLNATITPAKTGTLSLVTTGTGNIDLTSIVASALGGGAVTTITAGGNILGLPTSINGTTVNLGTSGTLGLSSLARLVTNAITLSVNAGNNAFIDDTAVGAVKLNTSTISGATGLDLLYSNALKKTTVDIIGTQTSSTGYKISFGGPDSGINLKANLTAGGAVTFNATGAGNITQGKSLLLTAGTLNVTSGKGSIGSSSAPVALSVGTLTANTGGTGNVYLTDKIPVTLTGSATAGGTFSLIDSGEELYAPEFPIPTGPSINATVAITAPTIVINANNPTNGTVALGGNLNGIGGAIAKSVTVQSTGFGATTSNVSTIDATKVTLLGGSGFANAGVGIDLNAVGAGLSANVAGAVVQSGGAVDLKSLFATAGKTFVITNAKSGGVFNIVASAPVTITAGAKLGIGGIAGSAPGSITIKSNGTTQAVLGNLTLTAGTLNYTNPGGFSSGGTVVAPTVVLSSSTGNVNANLQTGALTVTVTGSKTASVNITNTASLASPTLTLNKSISGGSFTLTTTGDLVSNGVVNKADTLQTGNDITLVAGTAGGAHSIVLNGVITANGGKVIIQEQSNSAGSSITISPSAKITTLIKTAKTAPSPALATAAEILIFTGAAVAQNAGSAPAGIVQKVTAPGAIFYGTSGGTLNGPVGGTAAVNALAANVTFDAKATTTISIGKGSTVTADPIVINGIPAAAHVSVPMTQAAQQPSHLVVVTNGTGGVQAVVNNVIAPSTTTLIPAGSPSMTRIPFTAPMTTSQDDSADHGVSMPLTMQSEFVIDTGDEVDSEGVVMNNAPDGKSAI